MDNPEEYEKDGAVLMKNFHDAKYVSKTMTREKIESELNKIRTDLKSANNDLSSLKKEISELEREMKKELSPEEVIEAMRLEREYYTEDLSNYGEPSEGDGLDHYQINHNALVNYFKLFSEHHPELCDKDGNLNIKYNNVKVKIS